LNYKSNNVIIEGTYKESFPDFHDDPKVGKKPKPPKEEKKPFNWGGVILGVVAAVVIVAVVAITAPVDAIVVCAVAVVGAGYERTAHFFNPDSFFSKAFYSKEALMGARKGIIAGGVISPGVEAGEYVYGYIKNKFFSNKSK
jgi:hypothetical protein